MQSSSGIFPQSSRRRIESASSRSAENNNKGIFTTNRISDGTIFQVCLIYVAKLQEKSSNFRHENLDCLVTRKKRRELREIPVIAFVVEMKVQILNNFVKQYSSKF